MKLLHPLKPAAFAVLAGTLGTILSTLAGEVVISNFDDPNDATLWTWESWSSEALVEHDATLDAGGGAEGSGSMRIINNFPDNPTGYSQAVVSLNMANVGGEVNAEKLYTKISLDIRLDPSSYPRVDGVNYGWFEVIFRNGSDWSWNALAGFELTLAYTNWTHLEFPVKAPGDAVHHLTLKLGQNYLTNTVIYNIDNLRWTEVAGPIPQPTMSIESTTAGLNLIAGTSGQYDRQNVKTATPAYGWVGMPEPMTYSFSIKKFPNGATYPGHNAHIYLVPGTPGTEEYPDWNEANCIIFAVHANTDGSAIGSFHYKTNSPGSNGPATLDGTTTMYFNDSPTNGPVGALGSVTSATALGTWSLSFSQDSNITMTAPDGASTAVAMPADDAALFAGDLTVYYGISPGNTANIGQTVVLNSAKITLGSVVLLEDDFSTSPLNTELWTVNAASSACVSLITATDPYWVSWTTPASGFVLQTNPGVDSANWTDLTLTETLLGTKKRVLVPSTSLPGTAQGSFRLIHIE